MRTHPTFYVGRLRPYHQYGTSSGEEIPCAQASPRDTCARRADYQPESEVRISPREVERYSDELPLARREENAVPARSQAEQKQNPIDLPPVPRRDVSHCRPDPNVCSSRARDPRATHTLRAQAGSQYQIEPANPSENVFPPPPHPLIDARGGQRFLVERLLNHRDEKGRRTSYLVRWRGYPPSADSWEPRSQLLIDVLGLVEQYDKAHPMPKKAHLETNAQRACRVISN
uniref:Chromo domain-containing protein n=1 Tax=Hyaloperonospora arabidopsidis (strain Emoy2) TaxID=559515 RepID=M4BFS8_HYAAE